MRRYPASCRWQGAFFYPFVGGWVIGFVIVQVFIVVDIDASADGVQDAVNDGDRQMVSGRWDGRAFFPLVSCGVVLFVGRGIDQPEKRFPGSADSEKFSVDQSDGSVRVTAGEPVGVSRRLSIL